MGTLTAHENLSIVDAWIQDKIQNTFTWYQNSANIAQKNRKLIASDKGFSMEELDNVDFISSMFVSRRVNGYLVDAAWILHAQLGSKD